MHFGLSCLNATAAFRCSLSSKRITIPGVSHHLGERARGRRGKVCRKKDDSLFREMLKEEIEKLEREMD